jgi:hypothetical protein
MAAMWTTSVHVEVAENAPVIRRQRWERPHPPRRVDPTTKRGDALHVWDWTKSPASSVHADIEFGEVAARFGSADENSSSGPGTPFATWTQARRACSTSAI